MYNEKHCKMFADKIYYDPTLLIDAVECFKIIAIGKIEYFVNIFI